MSAEYRYIEAKQLEAGLQFGRMLRRWREMNHWTQYTAYKWAKEAGFEVMAPSTLSVFENGKAPAAAGELLCAGGDQPPAGGPGFQRRAHPGTEGSDQPGPAWSMTKASCGDRQSSGVATSACCRSPLLTSCRPCQSNPGWMRQRRPD